MTTSRGATAEKLNAAGSAPAAKVDASKVDASKEKEKAEKRRALGRGLESLLPGPRVVPAGQADRGGARGIPEGASEAPGVPHYVRDDNATNIPASVEPGEMAGEPAADIASNASMTAAPVYEPQSGVVAEMQAQAAGRVPSNMVTNVPLDNIDKNPYQTRYLFDQELLQELADSIRVNGVVQPVVVRPAAEEGRYVLILGERRCRASKIAGKETVPAIVRRVSEQQAAEMTVIENLQRQDLNCLEQAEAFRLLSKEFNLTQEEIGARVGMSRESVSNYMRLLRLPEEVMQYLADGQMGFSEARELLSLDDATKIPALAEEIVKNHMSVEQIERMVGRMNGWLDPVPGMPGEEKKRKGGARWQDPNVRAAQLELERTLGLRVRIRDKKGKGKILIEYANVDDYERVVGMLRGRSG